MPIGLNQPMVGSKEYQERLWKIVTEPVEIHVLDHKVRLLQPAKGFRTSLDSVMVAAACPAQTGERVLDLGSGVGSASLCFLYRMPDCFITGVEIQADHVELARENAELNDRTACCDFIVGDIRDYKIEQPDQRFDHVLCNPPYLEEGQHMPAPDMTRAVALGHQDEDISLKDWIDCGFHNLQPGGSFTLIHRADQVDRIIQAFGKRFGAVEIIPLWPRAGETAKRVIIRARKDRRTPAILHPGLVLHNDDGSYTPAAEAVLRKGNALN